ncbi:NAD(P)H-binding protein [Nocardia yamanashiensis]|uniref:NmrA family NAD(P)-binding protein n=1 Tax=Nocardia yamanashiensis TaxID=209247 RepID=UPI001E2EFCAF|nr:NAD(P)H-binding protein [Nocardia yamanashiensis]UGT38549.1 NAD(P)H-binding protein [Nocardia yamanashiensis]
MTVLVLGATGKTGRPVVDALRARGVKVRAASRNPAPTADGVEAIHFDWADRTTWPSVLTGVHAMYVIGPYAEPNPTALFDEFLSAATQVNRIVLLSVLGADRLPAVVPMADWESSLRATGKQWTILRPNWFQQNFGEGAFTETLRAGSPLQLPAADAALAFIDTRDIAEVAAIALTEEPHTDELHTLTGPTALTHTQALEILGKAANRPLTYLPLTPHDFAQQLRTAGLPETPIIWQLGLFTLIRNGENALVTDTVERITGHPPRPLESYAREHADAWQAPHPTPPR